jgi:ribonuclease HI/NTP pyrophosphatase (non-canonical NTP hydrolase)
MNNDKLNELIELVKNNRKYSPWTNAASIEDFSKELLSESEEVVLAVKNNDLENLKEELGDVLFDVFMLFHICEEKYGFNADESVNMVIDKFQNRKPHIFEKKLVTLEEEKVIWHNAKAKEKTEKSKKEVVPISIKSEKSDDKIYINTDGGSRGNPGPAAIGIIIRNNKDIIIESYKEKIGITTNNVAEYKAISKALDLANKYKDGEIVLNSDSEVVVRQLTGKYKISMEHLKKLFSEVKGKEKRFSKVSYNHVFREDPNQSKADALVNEALDER